MGKQTERERRAAEVGYRRAQREESEARRPDTKRVRVTPSTLELVQALVVAARVKDRKAGRDVWPASQRPSYLIVDELLRAGAAKVLGPKAAKALLAGLGGAS